MQFPVPAYTSFTIPTGATTGARITFNENGNGSILVYNSANVVVDTIGGPNGDIISTDGVNTVTISGGKIFLTRTGVVTPAAFQLNVTGSSLLQDSPTAGANTHAIRLSLVSNTDSAIGNSAPFLLLSGTLGEPADIRLNGAIYYSAANWGTPGYAVGWAATTAFFGLGGGQGLRYRITAEDEVWLYGLAVTAAGATTTVFTLPAGFFNASNTSYGTALRNRAGTFFTEIIAITTAGVVITGSVPVAGDEFMFNFKVPLGHLS